MLFIDKNGKILNSEELSDLSIFEIEERAVRAYIQEDMYLE